MPREAKDFPTIPGFVPMRSGDAFKTAESPSVGTAATVPDDVLANRFMDDMLRSMILGDIESQNVLPLVYADLCGRLSGVFETNKELQEIRSRLGNVALEHYELRQHIRSIQSKMEALRRENDALGQRVRSYENNVATVGSTSPTASVAASLNAEPRNVPIPPTAIAPPEPRRAVPPLTAPVPSLVSPLLRSLSSWQPCQVRRASRSIPRHHELLVCSRRHAKCLCLCLQWHRRELQSVQRMHQDHTVPVYFR